VLTPAVQQHYTTPERIESSQKLYPMPRLCEPEDVANAVLNLASDEAASVNAATLMVDDGATVYMGCRTAHAPGAGLRDAAA
jgi:NAD(P)-dependent dehydrogenase (short-subunit alcohol dehydrogenase family)